MKYQVLARQYRPKTFSTMVGQDHVLKALGNALASGRLHHAYLFTGTRGVGKTTIARVLAKALNCEQGISAEPCGTCAACEEIDQGRFIDLIEVDAASRTKVEDTRELLDNVQYAPTRGRFKIYLIDEVHMLSGHSFNALLKTLEEPPPHVKFLLATTDPQKLPITILSRCLQFNLKSLTIEQIEQQLNWVLTTEEIPFENDILKPLAIAADGSMRDALSLLDQAIAYCDAKPNLSDIEAMLGCVQKQRIFELLTALANADGQALIAQSRLLLEQGIDVKTVLAELITTLQRIALYQQVPEAIDDSFGDKTAIAAMAIAFSSEDVQLYYQIALNGRKDLPYSPQPQGGFEMILLRMLAFKPLSVALVSGQQKDKKIAVPQTVEAVEAVEIGELPEKVLPGVEPATENTIIKKPANKTIIEKMNSHDNKKITDSTPNEKQPLADDSPLDYDLPPLESYSQESFFTSAEVDAVDSIEDHGYNAGIDIQHKPDNDKLVNVKKKLSIEESSETPYAAQMDAAAQIEPLQNEKIRVDKETTQEIPCLDEKSDDLASYWYDLIEQSQVDGLVQQLAKHCALAKQSEKEGILVLELLLESVHQHLLNDKMKKRLTDALQIALGSKLNLEIRECQPKQAQQLQTPRRREIQEAEILQQEAIKSIKTDPAVNLLLSSFSASLREETIKALDRQHILH